MSQTSPPDQIKQIIRTALSKESEFLLSGEPAPVKQGWRVLLLKTGTLNPDLSTSASVDRMRLLLDHALASSGYRIAACTQSKFELVLDIAPTA